MFSWRHVLPSSAVDEVSNTLPKIGTHALGVLGHGPHDGQVPALSAAAYTTLPVRKLSGNCLVAVLDNQLV